MDLSGIGGWGVQRLAELVELSVGGSADVDWPRTIESVAEALDAEVVAIVNPERILFSRGFRPGGAPTATLLGLARSETGWVELDGLGRCGGVGVAIPGRDETLVLARRVDAFSANEVVFLRAVVRLLALMNRLADALDAERSASSYAQLQLAANNELVATLRTRQELLERLARIQRSLSSIGAVTPILGAITIGGSQLFSADQTECELWLVDPANDQRLTLASSSHPTGPDEASRSCALRMDLVAQAIHGNELVSDQFQREDGTWHWTAAAPVNRMGERAGCLLVATDVDSPEVTAYQADIVTAFAEHASLALNDESAKRAIAEALAAAVHDAGHDGLTGLSNRTTLIVEMSRLATELQRSGETAVVLFVDLDRFKVVNDTAGHAVGDEVLRVTADRLRTAVRVGDTVARLAGDEFVVVCRDLGLEGGLRMADRIQDLLARPIVRDSTEVRVTASIGVAELDAQIDPEMVVGNADMAMYRAKQRGRNLVESFTPALRSEMVERMNAAEELRRAIELGQFHPVYQPVVDLESATLLGFEALCRWQHPERGVIPAREFITLAEESGLVTALDRAMVDMILQQMQEWAGSDIGSVVVSVNISAPDLADGSMVGWLDTAMHRYGIDPSLLWIELTESVAMDQDDRILAAAKALRDLGLNLVIDDFGTGYSSLSYLGDLPVKSVKIDRSLVTSLEGEMAASSAAIITAVAHVAASLDMTVVAEGVETTAQWEALRQIQRAVPGIVFLAQGWRFGYPVSVTEASHLLRNGLGITAPSN